MGYLIDHLRLWQKFALVSAIALLVTLVASALVIQSRYREIQIAQTELNGLAPVGDLITLIQQTQQHRGLSASLLAGNEAAKANREEKKTQVQNTLAKAKASVEALGIRSQRSEEAAQFTQIVKDWETLVAGVDAKSITGPQSYAGHTALIHLQLKLLDETLDASTLRLDPEAASYYLISGLLDTLPQMTESMGQARAKGTPMLAKGEKTLEERALMNSLATTTRLLLEKTQSSLARAISADPEIKTLLTTSIANSHAGAEAAVALVVDHIIKPEALSFSSQEYLSTITKHIDVQFTLIHEGFDVLHNMLEQRVQSARRVLWTFLASMLLAILVGAWIVVSMTRSATTTLGHALSAAQSLAQGKLSHRVHTTAEDEIGSLARTLGSSMQTLAHSLSGIQAASEAVDNAAQEIANGTQDLSSRTEQQASALQQTSVSMGELSQTVRQNAENARQANDMARQASLVATQGGDTVHKVVETMRGINDSSRRIADIISVIDGIAFQTNILALNAAVEAARAGEQGRGFAVVASEVRSLAGRSAEAASEIKRLITESVERVEAGTEQVDQAGASMQAIVQSIHRVTEIMGEISRASEAQNEGIAKISEAIVHMDGMTQQNAALVEQTAAASESLRSQSQQVSHAMSGFQL